jgi:hypothetical protein
MSSFTNLGTHGGAFGVQSSGIIIGVIVALGVILLRNSRPRRLRIERLWIRPALFIALLGVTLAAGRPPLTAVNAAILAVALALGCALGWQRGRFMRIEIDPASHELTARASPIGVVFILALLVGRLGLRGVLTRSGPVAGISALIVADALIFLAVGMMVTQGVEMWVRARRLLAQAGAGQVNTSPPDPILR